MNRQVVRRIGIGMLAIAALGACKKTGDGDSSQAGATSDASKGNPAAVTGEAIGGLDDANIFYVLDAANMADSVKGALASTKGTSAEIRDFANMMVRDHHTLRQQGQDLARRLAIQPAPPAGDSLPAKFENAVAKLSAAAKGRDFDKAYIDHEVAAHREVLAMAVSAMSATRNSEIKNLIQKAAPVIQAHLDKAELIQKNLQK